jgi:hypothetical protein
VFDDLSNRCARVYAWRPRTVLSWRQGPNANRWPQQAGSLPDAKVDVLRSLLLCRVCRTRRVHPLRGSTHGSGGAKSADAAMATGGLAGSGTVATSGGVSGTGGASVGGLRAGGASGSAGGASGGTSGTAPCAELAYDYCVEKCLAEYALSDNALCTNGAWSCRSGYVLASSCPVGACTVTPDACCDLTTGIVTKNSCATNGLRAPCSDGNVETYLSQAWCIPEALAGVTCSSLDRQPCAEPAVGCSDMSGGLVTCGCSSSGSDASAGTWHCSHYIGP